MDVSTVFERNYDSNKKIVVNRGGTRSSKTYSIAQLSVLWLITGCYGDGKHLLKGTWTTVRKHSTTLRGTVIKDFEEILQDNGWFNLVTHNKTSKTYSYNDRVVEFIGANDEQKLRGAKRDILYCNEANELTYKKEFSQLLFRTTTRIYIDFNPDDEDVWINTELEQKRAIDKGDVDVIVSTYLDNHFLSQGLVDEIEYLRQTDEEFWTIYGLGEYGKISGLIFKDITEVNSVPESAKFISYGCDFGYTNDPTSVTAVYRDGDNLYLDEIIYTTGLTNPDIFNTIKSSGLDVKDKYIFDSAEPKSIAELYNMGLNVHPAKKGKDSIVNGIDILKRYKIHVTSKSTNVKKEFKKYKWAVDKEGKETGKPIDMFNHAIDGIRYVALLELGKNNSGKYNIS